MRAGAVLGMIAVVCTWAQVSDQVAPRFKAIWEPVNVKADVKLMDVAFVDEQTGWVAGGKNETNGGVIYYTHDGGANWTAQFGDVESSDRAVRALRFVNQTTGWAAQSAGGGPDRLLHTTDGQNWDQVGTIAQHFKDYAFVSPTRGVHLDSRRIYLSTDAGRTWKPVAECRASAEVGGLTRQFGCEFEAVHFAGSEAGYAVAFSYEVKPVFFLFRTADGGGTWQVSAIPAADSGHDIFFPTPKTGFVRVGAADTGRLYRTDDGGGTWNGVAASPGFQIRFVDPQMGWAFHYNKLSYTTDGGARWNSRTFRFPAPVAAFSLPSRKRAYVVGEHGMVYRYRVVPVEFTAAGMIDAPMMP